MNAFVRKQEELNRLLAWILKTSDYEIFNLKCALFIIETSERAYIYIRIFLGVSSTKNLSEYHHSKILMRPSLINYEITHQL